MGQPQGVALVAAPQQVPNNAPVGAFRPSISAAGRGPIEPIPQQQLLHSKFGDIYIYLTFFSQKIFSMNLPLASWIGFRFLKFHFDCCEHHFYYPKEISV